MNNINQDPTMEGDIPQRAVSLYSQGDGMEDFPVLKAFQQYVDAEQEKARKRMMMMGIFFGVALIVVIAVFMVILQSVNSRSQALSDRLVEYAMKEADRRQVDVKPVTVQSNPASDAALKAMTETLSALQKKLEKKEEVKPQPAPVEQRHSEQYVSDMEKIRLEKQKLDEERRKIEADRQRLHEIEVDRQRRKLYPELYGEKPAVQQQPARNPGRNLTDEDIKEILREAYPDEDAKSARKPRATKRQEVQEPEESETAETKPESAKKTEPAKNTESSKKASDDSEEAVDSEEPMEAIEYFKDDEYKIPVDVKGSSVKFRLPVQ